MTPPSRLFIRAAGRLHNISHSRARLVARDETYGLRRVRDHLDSLQAALDRLDKANRLELDLTLPILRLEIMAHLERLRLIGGEAKESLRRPGVPTPGPGAFLEEFRQIEDDFDDFSIDRRQKAVRATTEPIT